MTSALRNAKHSVDLLVQDVAERHASRSVLVCLGVAGSFGPFHESPKCRPGVLSDALEEAADTIDALLPHLRARDVTFVLASGAPIEKLAAYRARMGWNVPY